MRRVLGLVVGVCALATLVASPCATAAQAPPEGPALAFTGFDELSASGITVNTLGYEASRPRVIVRGSRRSVTPRPIDGLAWSADGETLAFTGSKGKKGGIYVIRADGTGARFLRGTKGGSSPVFSPDGSKIAFAREGSSGRRLFASTPWVARVDGSGARRLLGWRKNATFTPESFSPDGSTLAVTRSDLTSEEPRILLLRLNRRGVRLLAEHASEPEFSPDGSRIVFVRHLTARRGKVDVTNKDLFTMSAAGEGVKRLTHTPWVAETQPSWDPSGQRVAFNSFRIGRDLIDRIFDELLPEGNSIAQINADGSCRERLFSRPGLGIYGAQWRPGPGRGAGRIECGLDAVPVGRLPAGPRLAVVKFDFGRYRFELETVDQTGAQPSRLAGGGELERPQPEWFTAPAWSPDGSKIVFAGIARRLEAGPKGTRLYVSRADGSGLRPLRGTHGADEPVFAPDGTAVAFTRTRFRPKRDDHGRKRFVQRGADVWLASLSGGAPKRITPARRGVYVYAKSFSPDGGALLGSRLAGKRPLELVEIDMATLEIETLLRRGDEPAYSPDGSRIAFVRWRPLERPRGNATYATDIFMIRAGGGGLRRLTDSAGSDRFPSWDPSGERVAFVRYRPPITELDEIGGGSALMQANADGSCLRTVLRPSRKTALYGAAWQPGPGREAGRIDC